MIYKVLRLFTSGLLLVVYFSGSLFSEEMEDKCRKELKTKIRPKGVVLIAYAFNNIPYHSKNNVILPAFHFKDGKFIETEFITPDVKKLYELSTAKTYKISHKSKYEQMGRGRCVSFAKTKKKVKEFSLFATEKLKLRKPTAKEIDFFYSINKKCVVMGDPIKPEHVECTKPKVLAISDINKNGLLEFWVKKPYMWDFGLDLLEQTKDKKGLKVLERACFGCD